MTAILLDHWWQSTNACHIIVCRKLDDSGKLVNEFTHRQDSSATKPFAPYFILVSNYHGRRKRKHRSFFLLEKHSKSVMRFLFVEDKVGDFCASPTLIPKAAAGSPS